jgi:dsRNA-specific ribonuclease
MNLLYASLRLRLRERDESNIDCEPSFSQLKLLGTNTMQNVTTESFIEYNSTHAALPNRDQLTAGYCNSEILSQMAYAMKIEELVQFRAEADGKEGKNEQAILASTVFAVIGAIFVDGGRDEAHRVFLRLVKKVSVHRFQVTAPKNVWRFRYKFCKCRY